MSALAGRGIGTSLLSGDDAATTATVARWVGIAASEGDALPEAKAALIQSWQEGGDRVAMVGDGINDGPALARADLSITAAGGTDVAAETSDIVLLRHDLTLIPRFLQLSGRVRAIIRQNLWWAFAYNLVAVPMAALGLLTPVFAAVTMSVSSLLVVLQLAPPAALSDRAFGPEAITRYPVSGPRSSLPACRLFPTTHPEASS